jgi:hypothetical protein
MAALLKFVVLLHVHLKWFVLFSILKQLRIILQHFYVINTMRILTMNTSINKLLNTRKIQCMTNIKLLHVSALVAILRESFCSTNTSPTC